VLTFCEAREDDLPALHALIESAYRGDSARAGWTHEADLIEGSRTSVADLAAIVADPDQCLLMASDEVGIVGCVQLSLVAPQRTYLGLVTIDPARQAGGLGRQLIAAAEAHARTRFGAREMEMTVISIRAELIAYYERRGYAPTGETRPFPVPLEPPLVLAVLTKSL
jgi:GNAT superfamily N-acetyltransferase